MAPPVSSRPWFLRSPGRWLAFVGLLFLGSLGCFFGGVWWLAERLEGDMVRSLRHADLHHLALQVAEADPRVVALLGSPMQAVPGMELLGHGHTPEGARAEFRFTVQGPRGHGHIRAQALWPGLDQDWRIERLELTYEGGALVLDAPPAASR
jgi:Cytochrome oxidase complex assembly protein 1